MEENKNPRTEAPTDDDRLVPKGPLVVTLKRKLMQHQEMKPKHPQIQTLSLKIAVSVNFQDLPVTQV